ncbi:MAG: hypothetical protein LBC38_01860 [Oscillospiraceae bacterium]|nr:hypothetical protein [Oscillospiraceae bacterium]
MYAKRGNLWFAVIAVLVGVAVIAYLAVYAALALRNGIITADVVSETSYDSMTLYGIVVRNEITVNNIADSGFIYVTADEGKRVSVGEPLARSYASKDMWLDSVKAYELDLQTSALISLLDERGGISESRLDAEIENSLENLRSAVKARNYRLASDVSDGVLELAVNSVDASAAIARLQAERSAIPQVSYTTIGASQSALFSKYADGYVGNAAIQPSMLGTMDGAALEELMNADPPPLGAIGKLVLGQTWYYAASVEQSAAKQLTQVLGKRVRIVFPEYGEFPMTVESVGEAYNGSNPVIFSCTRELQRLLTIRKTEAEIIINEYTGLRVPRSAIKLELRNSESETAEPCVYTAEGPYMIRKFVEIVRDDGDFYIVYNDVYSADALHEGDDVIISGTNLYNKKLISGN